MGISRQAGIGPFVFVTTLSTIFDGVDEGITYTNPTKLQLDTLSVGLWVKRADVTGTLSIIGRWTAGDTNNQAWVIQTTGTGKFRFAARTVAGTFRSVDVDDQAIFADTWVHIGITYTANTLLMYVDGLSVAFTGTVPVDLRIANANLAIGTQDGGSNYYLGQVDEASIFNVVLTPTEFLELKNIADVSKHSKRANLVFWDKMGEDVVSFPTYVDASANPISGTAANMEAADILSDVHS